MKKILISFIFLIVASVSSADTLADNTRYQQTKLFIKNEASYPVVLTIDNVSGNWITPVALKAPILLNVNQVYQNTLMSIKQNDDLHNFVSLDVASVDQPRENYLIFAESTSRQDQRVSADIFDGLGSLFVKSTTNYCKDTMDGYVYCELIIRNV